MRRPLAIVATVWGCVAAGWLVGLLIVFLDHDSSNGGKSVRNPHTGRVRPTPRPLTRTPQHGQMDLEVVADGDQVKMTIVFGDRRFWAAMTPTDALRIAAQFLDAAQQAEGRVEDAPGPAEDLLAESIARTSESEEPPR